MKKIKVYGGHLDGRHRFIVGATSMKEAARLFSEQWRNVSYNFCREYCCESGNPIEVELCEANPGVVFRSDGKQDKNFERLKKD